MTCPTAAALLGAPRFARGAAVRSRGQHVAFAFRVDGPPGQPDPFHWWLNEEGGWRLIDIRTTCARYGLPVPLELTAAYFSAAYPDWIQAVARVLAAAHFRPAPSPPPQPAPQPERLWWIED